jgi:hypothetical protein
VQSSFLLSKSSGLQRKHHFSPSPPTCCAGGVLVVVLFSRSRELGYGFEALRIRFKLFIKRKKMDEKS